MAVKLNRLQRRVVRPKLDELALKHGTDKSSAIHNYMRYYERYLEPRRDEPLIVVELGVAGGHSLRMWREYFPNARIVGVDYCAMSLIPLGVEVFHGAQEDRRFLEKIVNRTGPIDLVIDDASHRAGPTIVSFEVLWPHLKDRGIYVVEDLQTAYDPTCGPGSFIEYSHSLIDDVNMRGRSGHADVRTASAYLEILNGLTAREKDLESLHYYPHLLFLFKSTMKVRLS